MMIKNLGYRKVCSRFVVKFLTPEMKMNRLDCANSNLAIHQQYGDLFLKNIITEDETPLNLYIPESKRESCQWKKVDEKTPSN